MQGVLWKTTKLLLERGENGQRSFLPKIEALSCLVQDSTFIFFMQKVKMMKTPSGLLATQGLGVSAAQGGGQKEMGVFGKSIYCGLGRAAVQTRQCLQRIFMEFSMSICTWEMGQNIPAHTLPTRAVPLIRHSHPWGAVWGWMQ